MDNINVKQLHADDCHQNAWGLAIAHSQATGKSIM